MPKIKFEFELPQETSEFEIACHANKYHSVLFELNYNYFRKMADNEHLTQTQLEFLEIIRKDFRELLEQNEITNLD
jgi:hypothetical protein